MTGRRTGAPREGAQRSAGCAALASGGPRTTCLQASGWPGPSFGDDGEAGPSSPRSARWMSQARTRIQARKPPSRTAMKPLKINTACCMGAGRRRQKRETEPRNGSGKRKGSRKGKPEAEEPGKWKLERRLESGRRRADIGNGRNRCSLLVNTGSRSFLGARGRTRTDKPCGGGFSSHFGFRRRLRPLQEGRGRSWSGARLHRSRIKIRP